MQEIALPTAVGIGMTLQKGIQVHAQKLVHHVAYTQHHLTILQRRQGVRHEATPGGSVAPGGGLGWAVRWALAICFCRSN